jgi:hypothetical protein
MLKIRHLGQARARVLFGITLFFLAAARVSAADVYVRAMVIEPADGSFNLTVSGHIHNDPWGLPSATAEAKAGEWSPWMDLTAWKLHGRLNRVGGIAEWPSLSITLARVGAGAPVTNCRLQVQLADKPDPMNVAIGFTAQGDIATIAFLCPTPLHEEKAEFETASQMTARQLRWAIDATGGKARALKQYEIITSVWGQSDPLFADQTTRTLKQLGFNVMGGVPVPVMQKYGMRTYSATWHMLPDPEESTTAWWSGDGGGIRNAMKTPDGKWTYENMAHYVVCDEIQTLGLGGVKPEKLNGWFHDYLRAKGETDESMGKPIDTIEYPVKEVRAKTLAGDADLTTRKTLYYAAKFGQYWSVKSLRQTTDLVHETFKDLPKGMRTETLPSDHHFFNAWGTPSCGMDPGGLDFFEIGQQEAVDIISTEDWMGLNRMYGPGYTWTGGWAFGYLSAIFRSGIGDKHVALRGLITPSDDQYLRLKTYSCLGQGAKSLFYWTFGPTYIGTENYWSDLRSEYDGIAKFTGALQKAEPVLYPAKLVRDPVALLYSVSHDYWHTDDPASFVENRLTWTALRQIGVQPDILREEDVEAGKLANYKVLYVTGQCLTRKASAAIGAWVKAGGVVYLSGGAVTRDEFYTPYVPDFAKSVWPDNAADVFVAEQGHAYNERRDLPTIKPLTTAKVTVGAQPFSMKVIGCRLNLKDGLPATSLLASYEDGTPAGARVAYGKGTVVGVGFLPGLAYSPFKAGQATLDEVWAAAPRTLFALPLNLALKGKQALTLSVPVVEGSLHTGLNGAAIVLANYTYQPIKVLTLRCNPGFPVTSSVSTEGVKVAMKKVAGSIELTLPLNVTDIVILTKTKK